jgi:hypothetical protein
MTKTVVSAVALLCFVMAGSVVAVDLPGPKPEERTLASLPHYPSAPAVYLERRGTLVYDEEATSSMLEVYERIKILNKEGVSYGSISIGSSDFYRAKGISGRTHLPDGKVVDLPKDSTFERRYSAYYGATERTCALPEVVPGAIVEFGYQIYFDSVFYPSPWYFQAGIPTLLSSIAYEIPDSLAFKPVKVQTLANVPIEEEMTPKVRGRRATFTARNLPPVPDEPDRFPFAALSSRVQLLPVTWIISGTRISLLTDWEEATKLVWGSGDSGYAHAIKGGRKAKVKAVEVTRGATTPRDQAAALYRFVRDEIDTEDGEGIWIGTITADDVLDKGRGESVEKAVLLYTMLSSVAGIGNPSLAWTADRDRTYIQKEIPNTSQLTKVLVVLDLPEGKVFLDPTDRSAGFGVLRPDNQGMHCLVATRKNQEWIKTPALPAEASTRLVQLELALDEKGGIAGSGAVHLTGNHAWSRLLWRDSADKTNEAWQKWLEGAFPGFVVSELKVTEKVEDRLVDVSWKMRQREEEILGDEATLAPARPLRITSNPYALTAQQRRTPLQLGYADVDRVELKLSWPQGWVVESAPAAATTQTAAGSYKLAMNLDASARTLSVSRALTISKDQYMGGEGYTALRDLMRAAVEGDAAAVNLGRE